MNDFRVLDEAIRTFVEHQGWRRFTSSSSMLAAWSEFVDRCYTGYGLGIYEFENDRSVRDAIDQVMKNHQVADARGFTEFRDLVAEVDGRYKAILCDLPGAAVSSEKWWEQGFPKNVGDELAQDLLEIYNVAPQGRALPRETGRDGSTSEG